MMLESEHRDVESFQLDYAVMLQGAGLFLGSIIAGRRMRRYAPPYSSFFQSDSAPVQFMFLENKDPFILHD